MISNYFFIAEILRPHGIKGELKLKVYSDDMDNFKLLKKLYTQNSKEYVEHNVISMKHSTGETIVLLEDVDNRNDAEKLRGEKLYISRDNASPLEDSQYYINDIIGFEVVLDNNTSLGNLAEVLTNTSKDIYIVKSNTHEILFPLVENVLININLSNRIITIKKAIFDQVAIINEK